jgi:hypothetical protein
MKHATVEELLEAVFSARSEPWPCNGTIEILLGCVFSMESLNEESLMYESSVESRDSRQNGRKLVVTVSTEAEQHSRLRRLSACRSEL